MTTKTTRKKGTPAKTKASRKTSQPTLVDSAWLNADIELTDNNGGMRLSKRLASAKQAPSNQSPLGWLMTTDVDPATMAQVNAWHASLSKRQKRKRVAGEILGAIESLPNEVEDANQALIVLAACHAVRAIAGKCEFSDWQTLVSRLLELAQAADRNVRLPPAIFQQLAIEVPLTIAYQIPEIEDHLSLAARKCQQMASRVSDMLDHDGWPSARYLRSFGPIVASWVRCSVLATELKLDHGLEAASQLEWLVRQLVRMLRPDGTLVFSEPGSAAATPPFLKCLLELSSDPDDKRLVKYATDNDYKPKTASAKLGIEPSNISEWSESALLQSRWEHGSPKVAVDFSGREILTEICCETCLIRGDTAPEISINGVAVRSSEPFEAACIESDEDIDYLELAKDLGRGVTLTRQFLLSRNEGFLLVADLVVPSEAARIDYRSIWPLAAGVDGLHETETREVYLQQQKKIQSLVLPLALPEWKVGRSDDKLDFQDGSLCLTQSIDGRGLYAPLFFDLNPKRSRKKRTWRQLTVAENLIALQRDAACAFRVQLNEQQWVFYRTVSTIGNRTFLGENTVSEFVFSRFKKDGSVEQLIEIE